MSRTPFDDATGGGPDHYSGNPEVRTPALGRSSRDLAFNAGPAGASEETFTAGDRGPNLTTGHAGERAGEPPRRRRAPHPEIDPDARLGLHPTIPPKDVPGRSD